MIAFDRVQTLYEADHIKIDHFSNDNKNVVITFTDVENTDLEGLGYAGKFLAQQSVDIVAFKTSRGHYYQNLGSQLIAEIFSECLKKYERRIAYGYSMGGFAAYVFSKPLDVDFAVCIAPRAPEDSLLISSKKRLINFSVQTELSKKTTFLCVFDPHFIEDQLFINKVTPLIEPQNLLTITFPFSGHTVPHRLHECGMLKFFSACAVASDIPSIVDLFKRQKEWSRSQTYFHNLSKACLKKNKLKTALALIDRAISMDTNVADFHRHKSKVLQQLGHLDESIRAAERAITLAPDLAYPKYGLSLLLLKKGLIEEANTSVDQALAIHPRIALFHWQKSIILDKLGKIAEALIFAKIAASLEPNDVRIKKHFSQLAAKQILATNK